MDITAVANVSDAPMRAYDVSEAPDGGAGKRFTAESPDRAAEAYVHQHFNYDWDLYFTLYVTDTLTGECFEITGTAYVKLSISTNPPKRL